LVTAVARQSSASASAFASSERVRASTVTADRSVVLKGAGFDREKTIDVNRPTRAQAASAAVVTTITALDVEVFYVNISRKKISGS